MTVAVKEIARMCQTNSEPIPRSFWCWVCDLAFGEFDLPKHEGHDYEEEGKWVG